jgi:hypothetical protein
VAEVAHAECPEEKACRPGEFWSVLPRDGVSDQSCGDYAEEELAVVWDGRRFKDVGGQTGEGACASAKEEFAPIKFSVVVHSDFGRLDKEVDGCADDCAGYEMSFSVWHRGFLFCFGVSAIRFFHGWIIPCGSGQNKGKVWGH